MEPDDPFDDLDAGEGAKRKPSRLNIEARADQRDHVPLSIMTQKRALFVRGDNLETCSRLHRITDDPASGPAKEAEAMPEPGSKPPEAEAGATVLEHDDRARSVFACARVRRREAVAPKPLHGFIPTDRTHSCQENTPRGSQQLPMTGASS
jgi:hypothetical protein